MPQRDLTPDQATGLVDTRDPVTGVLYPPAGLQPYHDWLIQSLHRLLSSSAGDLRVAPGDSGDTAVYVAAGRATVDGTVLIYAGGDLELGAFNNDTALVWLEDDSGSALIGAAASGTGWPGGAHLKLAEVELAGGEITSVTDRRFETMLSV